MSEFENLHSKHYTPRGKHNIPEEN